MFAPLEVTVLVPVMLTGRLNTNGLAPDTVMLLPIWMRAPFVNTRFVGGVVPPTTPEKVIFPPVPAFIVRAVAPLMVLEKLMFAPAAAPLVVFKVGDPEITTGPVIVMTPPPVVILPATLIAVEPM